MMIQPLIDQNTGNFEMLLAVFLSEDGQILLEMKPDCVTLPTFPILPSDKDEDKEKMAMKAFTRRTKEEFDVEVQVSTYLGEHHYEEDLKHFNCHYVTCTQWEGEIAKNAGNKRLLWAQKSMATSILSTEIDKNIITKHIKDV